MQARRPGNQNDHHLNPRALAAIAEAARRSREAGVGPEPPNRDEVPRMRTAADETVTAPASRRAAQAAATTSHTGYSPAVRERFGTRAPGDPPPPLWGSGPADFAESPVGDSQRRTRPPGSGERRLRRATGIAAGVLVVVVVALVGTALVGTASDGDGQPDAKATATTGSPATTTIPAPSGSTGTTSGQGGVSSTSTSTPTPTSTPTSAPTSAPTSTSSQLAEPGGPPGLSALAPANGQAGQTVTVTGSNLLSSSGRISAQVGGQIAPVACPDQTTCTVVIPPDPGPTPSAPVTITTDVGTSNALLFTYGSPGTTAVPGGSLTSDCADQPRSPQPSQPRRTLRRRQARRTQDGDC